MEKMKIKERVNWPVTILLLLGLLTGAFNCIEETF